MIDIGKAKERAYILNFGWSQPGCNSVEFYRVHGKFPGFDNHAKVFDFRDIELTLLKL